MTICHMCKKLNIVLFYCKCKSKYCARHIAPECHKCNQLQLFKEIDFNKNKKILEDGCTKNTKIITI